jgi:putative transcriptional regulator
LRREIVEMKKDQHDLGIVTDDELRQVTIRMLGRDALPKTPSMSPKAIIALRERLGVSQAVFGGYLNVETQTVSMWERGARKPTGTALKLLQIVKNRGLEVLQ